VLFPTGADHITHVRAETAFGVAVRNARREVPPANRWEVPVSYGPTTSFTEAGDDVAGAVLFGDGLVEYEALPDEHGRISRVGLTLIRAVGYLSRSDLTLRPSGHAGPGLPTPGAQCLGRHQFRLAFEPRIQPPSNALLFERAASFTAPVHVVTAASTGGTLPLTASFLTIRSTSGAVVLSACHKAIESDSVSVRVFNPDDTPATIAVGAREPLRNVEVVDFLERPIRPLTIDAGAASVDVAPQRIVSLKLSR
jgi:2-O-(6-phospho-alpha-D-mannosyl)-D-glycerate hydrolase